MSFSPERQVAFSLCAFKAGVPVLFPDSCGAFVAAPLESCDIEEFFSSYGREKISLLLSAEQRNFHSGDSNENGIKIFIKNSAELTLGRKLLIKVADAVPTDEKEELLILLTKMAELLPEVLLVQLNFESRADMLDFSISNGLQIVELTSIVEGIKRQRISRISEAKIRIRDNIDSKVVSYRSLLKEHYAIIIGNPLGAHEPLVRIHSSCYTGDLLGSLSCDCRDQLHDTVTRMADDPVGGIILYLSQEGRGIGLSNKMRAYNLQEKRGLDTVEANLCLGFKDDERDFKVARLMLEDLGIQRLRLMTNNPRKIHQLSSTGIEVASRVPILVTSNPHNSKYLQTKSERLGHIFTA